jgi:hypothetical protein
MRGTIMGEVRELARQATQVAMVLAGCILALGMAWNLFQGIISYGIGHPILLAKMWGRLVGMLLGFLIAILAAPIVNALIDVVGSFK